MIFALDTNTASYALRREGGVGHRLDVLPPTDVGIPAICAYELLVGARRRNLGAAPQGIEFFLRRYGVLAFDESAARHTADIDAYLTGAGTLISQLDTLIAGVVRSQNLTLVTRNTREFSRVPGLLLEDWY